MLTKYTIELTDQEIAKLEALATARRKSTQECIRDFIASSVPGGSGWKHPATRPRVIAFDVVVDMSAPGIVKPFATGVGP